MPSMTVAPPSAPLIGAYVPEVLSLAKRGIFWAVLYGLFARASKGGCVASPEAPATCFTATLGPSPLVWLAMAILFVVAVGRAAKATDTAVVTRILSRTATAMWVIVVVAAVIGLVSFFNTPPEAWIHTTPPPNVTVDIIAE